MQFKRIRLGVTCTYLIPTADDGFIMIDTGEPRLGGKFKRTIAHWSIAPSAIRLLIITHAHYDHVGSLADIKECCRCPVLIHPLEDEILQKALVMIPPGTSPLGKVLSPCGHLLKPFMRFPASKGDILVHQRYDLSKFGVAGEVVPTPGHTPGSLAVIMASGEAFVGDLAMNFLGGDNFPIFGESIPELNKSRAFIRSTGAHTIYPAHGKPFAASHLI